VLKFLIKLTAAAVVTILLSAVLLARSISDGFDDMSAQNGDWVTSVATGSQNAGVMLKAAVAIGGLLASTQENSMYYRLSTIAGEPLRMNCRYRIEGADYAADWWSITAYGWDNYLIPNPQKRYSFNNENLIRNADGSWVITVAATEQAGNWLPVGPSGAPDWRKLGDYDFDLLLRLYTPGDAYLKTPQSATLPTVTREACQ
jgi:hypothetical protein